MSNINDDELARIRAQRLAQLQSQSQSQLKDDSDIRHTQLSSFLTPEARDRLRRIALVKPDRAQSIEDMLLRMARGGQIRGKVSEDELVGLLSQVGQDEKKGGIVKMRKEESDDDWD